jgi:hypothetical protein
MKIYAKLGDIRVLKFIIKAKLSCEPEKRGRAGFGPEETLDQLELVRFRIDDCVCGYIENSFFYFWLST